MDFRVLACFSQHGGSRCPRYLIGLSTGPFAVMTRVLTQNFVGNDMNRIFDDNREMQYDYIASTIYRSASMNLLFGLDATHRFHCRNIVSRFLRLELRRRRDRWIWGLCCCEDLRLAVTQSANRDMSALSWLQDQVGLQDHRFDRRGFPLLVAVKSKQYGDF